MDELEMTFCPKCKGNYLEWVDPDHAICLYCGNEFNVHTGKCD